MELDWPVSGRVMKRIVFRLCEGIVGQWVGGVCIKRGIRGKNEEVKDLKFQPCRSGVPLPG